MPRRKLTPQNLANFTGIGLDAAHEITDAKRIVVAEPCSDRKLQAGRAGLVRRRQRVEVLWQLMPVWDRTMRAGIKIAARNDVFGMQQLDEGIARQAERRFVDRAEAILIVGVAYPSGRRPQMPGTLSKVRR